MKFEVGDKVKYGLSEPYAALTPGDTYIVKKVEPHRSNDQKIWLEGQKKCDFWWSRRFTLVERANMNKELEAFQEKVIEETLNHPSGCEQGKREFLGRLGLKPKNKKYMISFEYDPGDQYVTLEGIAGALRGQLSNWKDTPPTEFTVEEIK